MIRYAIEHAASGDQFNELIEWVCTHTAGTYEVHMIRHSDMVWRRSKDGVLIGWGTHNEEHMKTTYNSKPETINKAIRIINLAAMAVRSGEDISIQARKIW